MLQYQTENYTYQETTTTREWSVDVRGDDMVSLMIGASEAMYELSGIELESGPTTELEFKIERIAGSDLFIDFFSELLARWSSQRLALVGLDAAPVNEACWQCFGSFKPVRSQDRSVKTVTHHGLDQTGVTGNLKTTVTFEI